MRFAGKLWAAIAFLAIVAMVSQVAMAQNNDQGGRRGRGNRGGGGPGGPGGGQMSGAMILGNEKVQELLKLNDEQKEKIKKITQDSFAEMRKAFQDGGRPDREKLQKLRTETGDKVNDVLDEGQRKKLMGITIQLAGVASVLDPAVAKELNITDDQKAKIRETMTSAREAGGRDNNTSFADRRAKLDTELKAVLTSEQQEKLESLKGEKVDIDFSAFRGGRGGDRGGNRGRDRGNRGNDQPAEKKAA